MIPAALLIPLATAVVCYFFQSARLIGYVSLAGAALSAAVVFGLAAASFGAPIEVVGGLLYMDALSGYVAAMVAFLGLASSLYSIGYLEHELSAGLTDLRGMRRYYALFHLFLFTMLLVVMTNNLAVMWIAIEATTIVSAALIGLGFYKRELAIEAAWKYLILCTVGITFALLGVFIAYYASIEAAGGEGTLDWTELRAMAATLNPATMKLAFIFVLVGYGAKAGLAPVHNWLPDAHSEAPSPISALLSGVLLNTAFYGIMRFVSFVSPSTGSAFTGTLLVIFGVASVGIASIFILVQDNYKRLLAYSSIEHMGVICLGMGIGGAAALYGALLHMFNHAVAKPLMFFTSGKIQAQYGSTSIDRVGGVLSAHPVWGTLTFIGVLALAGMPPFNIFISEFSVLRAGADRGSWVVVGLILFFLAVAFYGMLSAFGRMLLGGSGARPSSGGHTPGTSLPATFLSAAAMVALGGLVVFSGLRVPGFVNSAIEASLGVLGVR
ncbi:MAG: hydrogenase 4 subunit F [Thermodesulfovibrionales bacterium]